MFKPVRNVGNIVCLKRKDCSSVGQVFSSAATHLLRSFCKCVIIEQQPWRSAELVCVQLFGQVIAYIGTIEFIWGFLGGGDLFL